MNSCPSGGDGVLSDQLGARLSAHTRDDSYAWSYVETFHRDLTSRDRDVREDD